MGLNQSRPMHDAAQAFIVTVGLPMGSQAETNRHCEIVLRAIERAGYLAGATSTDVMKTIAETQNLVDGMVTERGSTE